ncbi:hypothetical protein E5940_000100 [Enterococcus faecalis]|nr:hypothetical protein [Enterococcus faecalis]
MYHDIALSAFRYLGCHSFEEVDRMTMSEFELRMIAFNLAEVDEERKKTQLATVAERLRRYREGRRVDGE